MDASIWDLKRQYDKATMEHAAAMRRKTDVIHELRAQLKDALLQLKQANEDKRSAFERGESLQEMP